MSGIVLLGCGLLLVANYFWLKMKGQKVDDEHTAIVLSIFGVLFAIAGIFSAALMIRDFHFFKNEIWNQLLIFPVILVVFLATEKLFLKKAGKLFKRKWK